MTYKLTFFDYWHIGSGLSGGAKHDLSVLRDMEGFPYVPGKSIKGLLRECAIASQTDDFVQKYLGNEGEHRGLCHFSNATLPSEIKEAIGEKKLFLFDTIAQTKIDEQGVAADGSLREIEVVIPLELYGSIEGIPSELEGRFATLLAQIKRMGLKRTRGLGRCVFEVQKLTQGE